LLLQVIIIQKYYRRWLAKKYVAGVREKVRKRQEWEEQEEINKRKEKEGRIQQEFERRMNPKSKEDFELLFRALDSKQFSHCHKCKNMNEKINPVKLNDIFE